jgi:hypothetical protein
LLGYNIDFITIHGRPFEEVINEIKLCDFVVDQIYSDTPMAGFATEAACFGKPAIVAGYGLESLKEYIPESMWPPSLICVPNDIQNAIEDLILNVNKRNDLGIAAQKFVCEKWNAIEVAKKYLRIINNDIPKSWWLDPFKVSYLHGVGQSEEETKKIIHNLVMKHGKKSLQVSNKPSLENLFLAFSDQNYSFNKKSNNIF